MGDGYSTVDDPTADHPAQPARAASGVDSLMGGGSGGNAGVHGGGQVHAAEPANALERLWGVGEGHRNRRAYCRCPSRHPRG